MSGRIGIIEGESSAPSWASQYTSAMALQHLPATVLTVYDGTSISTEKSFKAGWFCDGDNWSTNYAYLGTTFPPSLFGM